MIDRWNFKLSERKGVHEIIATAKEEPLFDYIEEHRKRLCEIIQTTEDRLILSGVETSGLMVLMGMIEKELKRRNQDAKPSEQRG